MPSPFNSCNFTFRSVQVDRAPAASARSRRRCISIVHRPTFLSDQAVPRRRACASGLETARTISRLIFSVMSLGKLRRTGNAEPGGGDDVVAGFLERRHIREVRQAARCRNARSREARRRASARRWTTRSAPRTRCGRRPDPSGPARRPCRARARS